MGTASTDLNIGDHLADCWHFRRWMPTTEQDFEWLRSLSVLDLLHLASVIPLLVRAKLCGIDVTWDYLRNSSQTGLLSDVNRTLVPSPPSTPSSNYNSAS